MRRKARKGYWRNRYAVDIDEINSAAETAEADRCKARMRFWQYVGFKVEIPYPTTAIHYEEGVKYIYLCPIYKHSGSEEIAVEFSVSERAIHSEKMEADGLLSLDKKEVQDRMESEMPVGMSLIRGDILGYESIDARFVDE